MSNQAGRYQRSFPGLVGAMAVLIGVVLVFVLVRASVREDLETPVRDVDYAASMGFFEQQAGFALLAPPTLPSGWVATNAEVDPGPPPTWRLNIFTADEKYVGLQQAVDSEASMVEEFVDEEAEEGDPVDVAGRTWTSYSDDGGDIALARTDGEVTTVVVGTVSMEELVGFVSSLQ